MGIKIDRTALDKIDLASLIEQETSSARFGKAVGNGEKRTQTSCCPWCGGDDRFAVVDSVPQHFYCGIHGGSGCKRHGNAIDFMKQWHDMRMSDICKRLGLAYTFDDKPFEASSTQARTTGIRVDARIEKAPCEEWQTRAGYFLRVCQGRLWSEAGKVARDELARRGFTEAEMKEHGFGYNSKEVFDNDVSAWGIKQGVKVVWLPRGIVIPWIINDVLYAINIRRRKDDMIVEERHTGRKGSKYVNVLGGSNPIYRGDTLTPGQPVIIFEGEFNAALLASVLKRGDALQDVAIIATGSTGKGRSDNWLVKIAQASQIIISFDPDSAGSNAVKSYWSKVLPGALVWPTVDGDLGEMFLMGNDIVKWAQTGLRVAQVTISDVPEVAPTIEPVSAMAIDTPDRCVVCNLPIDAQCVDFQFVPISDTLAACYCDNHYPGNIPGANVLAHAQLLLQLAGIKQAGWTFEVFHESETENVKARVLQEYKDRLYNFDLREYLIEKRRKARKVV